MNNDVIHLGKPGLKITRLHGGSDNCCMCSKDTPHWFEAKDVPLCFDCAYTFQHEHIPSKAEWLKRLGYFIPTGWAPYKAYTIRENDHDSVVS